MTSDPQVVAMRSSSVSRRGWGAGSLSRRLGWSESCAVSVAMASHGAEEADDLAEHLHVARADRLHRAVLRLQPDVVGLTEVALHGGLLTDQGDDDLAVGRGVLLAHDDEVPLEDPRVDHRVA